MFIKPIYFFPQEVIFLYLDLKSLTVFSLFFFSAAVEVASLLPVLLPVVPVLPHCCGFIRSSTDRVSYCFVKQRLIKRDAESSDHDSNTQ